MSAQKDSAQLVRRVRKLGFEVEHTRGGHYRAIIPGVGVVVWGKTPSDHRSIRNAVSQLKRKGVKL